MGRFGTLDFNFFSFLLASNTIILMKLLIFVSLFLPIFAYSATRDFVLECKDYHDQIVKPVIVRVGGGAAYASGAFSYSPGGVASFEYSDLAVTPEPNDGWMVVGLDAQGSEVFHLDLEKTDPDVSPRMFVGLLQVSSNQGVLDSYFGRVICRTTR